VVGYGSIGRRHSRILKEFGLEVALVSRQELAGYKVFKTIEKALQKYRPEYIVIANETFLHYSALEVLDLFEYSGMVLIEKPIFECTKPLISLNNRDSIAIGYNLRFHPLLASVREMLKQEKILSANIYVGQFLPNWRDNDYRRSYSASEAKGGGVLRDLSHELDYCYWLFGDWIHMVTLGKKVSDLKIKGCDLYNLLIETSRCPSVNIQMSYLDLSPRRQIIINTAGRIIFLDLINNILSVDSNRDTLCIDKDFTYREMHRALLNEDFGVVCSFAEGLKTLTMIESAEESSRSGLWVSQ
jgi:predicted dehydrogenase